MKTFPLLCFTYSLEHNTQKLKNIACKKACLTLVQLSDNIKITITFSTDSFKGVFAAQYVSLAQIVSMIAAVFLIPTWLDS